MKQRTLLAIGILVLTVVLLIFFKDDITTYVLQSLSSEVPGLNCQPNEPCTKCYYKEDLCICDSEGCACGNETLPPETCGLHT